MPYVVICFFFSNGLRLEIVACFVVIGGIVEYYRLNFLVIMCTYISLVSKHMLLELKDIWNNEEKKKLASTLLQSGWIWQQKRCVLCTNNVYNTQPVTDFIHILICLPLPLCVLIIKLYPSLCILHLASTQKLKFPIANHLKFLCKISNHKRKVRFDFSSWAVPLFTLAGCGSICLL
jgi:hypothetical protein